MPVLSGETLHDARQGGYRYEAFFYSDRDEFMDGTLGFIRESVAAEEPILVVLCAEKIGALQTELRRDADRVLFADMDEVGTNPARIIPAWHDFLAHHARDDRQVRGVGEPIWAARSTAELAECQRHEALLNVAFAGPAFWLLRPYDTSALREQRTRELSASSPGVDVLSEPFDDPLPETPADAVVVAFQEQELAETRRLVTRYAMRAGLTKERAAARPCRPRSCRKQHRSR